MKRCILFAAVAAMLATSCQKTEMTGNDGDFPNAIGFGPATGKQSKAINQGTSYVTTETFGMFAYAVTTGSWDANGDLTVPTMGTSAGADPVEISYQAPVWKAKTGSYYWPNNANTKISFFGYSPFKDATTGTRVAIPATFSKTDGVTFTNYVNTEADAKVTDLMYATPVKDLTYASAGTIPGRVDFTFNHALTQVLFRAKTDAAYTGVTITVKKITLDGITSNGTFKALAADKWSAATTPATLSYVIYDNATGAALSTTLTAEGTLGDAQVMIPQDLSAQTFTVVYSIAGTGVADETVTKTVQLRNAVTDKWAINQKITYNLTVGLNEITFSPSITDWTPVSVAYIKDVEATEAAINAAITDLASQKTAGAAFKGVLKISGNATPSAVATFDLATALGNAAFEGGDKIVFDFAAAQTNNLTLTTTGWTPATLTVSAAGAYEITK